MLAERLAVVAGFGHTVVSEECDRLVCGLVTESVDTELPALVYSRVVCTDAAEILLEDLLAQDELGGVGPVASLEVGYELLKGVVLRVDLLRRRADDGERGQHWDTKNLGCLIGTEITNQRERRRGNLGKRTLLNII